MPTYIVKVSDRLIYDRTAALLVEADNEDQAEELARNRCISDVDIEWDESQSDATPYEIDEISSGDELSELTQAERRRPLDYDEEMRLQELRRTFALHWREIQRFKE